ncbi:hypothetical protein NDU88_000892 [Pleurodeles waltl]|uniref:Uncharacterized protein n=1 Tax=Pleurodeles waltl TaxID=8319 RepID=A0AAV7KWZ5_PLEWA|nr:hypothetical protein NDU88_000892 [Pleurodeles waltl]
MSLSVIQAVLRSPEEIDIGTGTGTEFSHLAPTKGPTVVEGVAQQKRSSYCFTRTWGRSWGPATAVTIQGEPEASQAGEQAESSATPALPSTTGAPQQLSSARPHKYMPAPLHGRSVRPLTRLLQQGPGPETKGGDQRGPGGVDVDVDSPLVRGSALCTTPLPLSSGGEL